MNSNKKTSKRTGSLQELLMYCLIIISVGVLFLGILANRDLAHELAQGGKNPLFWPAVVESITNCVMLFCAVMVFAIMQNVRKGKVFVKANANYIQFIGLAVMLNGFAQIYLLHAAPEGSLAITRSYYFFLLLGVFIGFIGCVFQIGIRIPDAGGTKLNRINEMNHENRYENKTESGIRNRGDIHPFLCHLHCSLHGVCFPFPQRERT